MVDGAALEKRSPRKWSVGSNPTLSAIIVKHGEVLEWPIRRAWRARVAFWLPWVRIPPSPPYHYLQ